MVNRLASPFQHGSKIWAVLTTLCQTNDVSQLQLRKVERHINYRGRRHTAKFI